MATIAGGRRARQTRMAWGAQIKAEIVFETQAQEGNGCDEKNYTTWSPLQSVA